MAAYRFDSDTAGHPEDHRGAPPGPDGATTTQLEVQGDWNVDGSILNGGYLQTLAVRAALDHCDAAATPIAVSTTFAAPARPGPARVAVQVLRRGRRVTTLSATLLQGGAPLVQSLITAGAAGPAGSAPHPPERGAAPDTPSYLRIPPSTPDDAVRIPAERMPGPPGLTGLIDYAFAPEVAGWLDGDTTGGPHLRCWLSFLDGRPIDALAVTALMDMAPPVSFAQGRFGWAPTLQLQVGLFAVPSGGPVLLDLTGAPYDGTVVAEDGLLWDADGTLLARSRQIALAPRT